MLQELLFPRKCVLCQRLLEKRELDLCGKCREETPGSQTGGRSVPHIQGLTALWVYEGAVRESLHRYKFTGARYYAPAYGRLLGMRVQQELPEAEVITWVPVSKQRRRQRGYDQSELLARAMGRELGLPVERFLEKFRDNQPNSALPKAEQRRANVLGVYRVKHMEALQGRRVLLVDDILTTGATASECARVLLTAGAKTVTLAAIAARGKKP